MKNFFDRYGELIGLILVVIIFVSGILLIFEKQKLSKLLPSNSSDSSNDEVINKLNDLEKRIKNLEEKNTVVPASISQNEQTKNMININTANLDGLDSLSGIGPAKAQAIIDYRNSHGGFKSIQQIQNVKGIGASIYEQIKNSISI